MLKKVHAALGKSPAAPAHEDALAGSFGEAKNLANYGNTEGTINDEFRSKAAPLVAPNLQFD